MRHSPAASHLVALGLSLLFAAASLGAQKKVFVTNESGFGDLTDWDQVAPGTFGVEAANSICQKIAEDASLDNAGDYRAWLSDSTTDAYCNVAGFSGKKASNCGQVSLPDGGPWVLTTGKPFARSLSELTGSGAVLWVPRVDQHGTTLFLDPSTVMTGTLATGTYAALDCDGWIDPGTGQFSQTGVLSAGTTGWTQWSHSDCNTLARLYCFESGSGAALERFAQAGAYAFVTSATGTGILDSWDDAGVETGIAAGDAVCRQAAVDGRLPSPASFVAWLSDGAADAKDRLATDGPYRRPDGVQIASSKIQLLTSLHEAAIEVDELGNHLSVYTFTGSYTNGVHTGDSCGDWLSTEGIAGAGLSSAANALWSSGLAADCGVPSYYHLFCLSNVVTIFADSFESGTSAWSASVPNP